MAKRTVEELREQVRREAAMQSAAVLVETFERTNQELDALPRPLGDQPDYLPLTEIRGLVLDELNRRDSAAMDAWLENRANHPSQRPFYLGDQRRL
jgi:hypothetical protein